VRDGRYGDRGIGHMKEEEAVTPALRSRRARRSEDKGKPNRPLFGVGQFGVFRGKHGSRWAVRWHGDWLMSVIFEHFLDKARDKDTSRCLDIVWEISWDLDIPLATVSRKIKKLVDLKFITVRRTRRDKAVDGR
jgi:hypothetical protein